MKKYLIMTVLPVIGGLSLLAAVPNVDAATNYTLAEVKTHNTLTSCWVANSDKVYDLTSYLNAHPVGAVLVQNLCGTNLRRPFTTAPLASNTLSIGLIGDLASTTDIVSPTAPTNLTGKIKNYNRVKLSWTAASDNIAIAGYKIFRNDTLIAKNRSLVFTDHNLTASTTYKYSVIAYDKIGNDSATSSSISVTTLNTIKQYKHEDKDKDDEDKKESKKYDKKTINKFLQNLRSDLRKK